jgi:hypothetical protein
MDASGRLDTFQWKVALTALSPDPDGRIVEPLPNAVCGAIDRMYVSPTVAVSVHEKVPV